MTAERLAHAEDIVRQCERALEGLAMRCAQLGLLETDAAIGLLIDAIADARQSWHMDHTTEEDE